MRQYSLYAKIPIICLAVILTVAIKARAESPDREYLKKGVECIKDGEYEKAIDFLSEAIRINQKDAIAYTNRGAAYGFKKDFVNAISDFSSAIDIDPGFAEAYHNRGAIYYKIGSLEKAIADFDKAIRINPAYAKAYNSRALALFYKQEYEKSWDDVRKAQDLGYEVHPGFLEALNSARAKK